MVTCRKLNSDKCLLGPTPPTVDSTSICEVEIIREIEDYQNVYGNESTQSEGIVGFKEVMEAPIEGRFEIITGTLEDKNGDGLHWC